MFIDMVTETDPIWYSKNGRIAHIVLNRPQVVNAYNMRMRDELYQALEAVRDDPDVIVAILRGEGTRGFCAGADLTDGSLSRANLSQVSLVFANLTNANLANANLAVANLTGADLDGVHGADFRGAENVNPKYLKD